MNQSQESKRRRPEDTNTKDLVMTAKLIGLVELVRNLASAPVRVPRPCLAASAGQREPMTV